MFPTYFFDNQVPRFFDRHLSQFKDRPVDFLQIGAFTGDATAWLKEYILTHPDSILVDVDTWEGSEEHENLDFSLVEKEYDSRIAGMKNIRKEKTTSDEFFQLNEKMFDFIYIDGNHAEDQVFKDAVNAIQVLKNGGIIAFDDFFHPPVKAAISDILDIKPLTVIELAPQQAWFTASSNI